MASGWGGVVGISFTAAALRGAALRRGRGGRARTPLSLAHRVPCKGQRCVTEPGFPTASQARLFLVRKTFLRAWLVLYEVTRGTHPQAPSLTAALLWPTASASQSQTRSRTHRHSNSRSPTSLPLSPARLPPPLAPCRSPAHPLPRSAPQTHAPPAPRAHPTRGRPARKMAPAPPPAALRRLRRRLLAQNRAFPSEYEPVRRFISPRVSATTRKSD